MMRRLQMHCLGLLVVGMSFTSWALEFRLQGERLTLKAHNDSLEDVLQEFGRAGVAVKMDPRVTATITGAVKDYDLQTALDELLGKFDYILIWSVLDGPVGDIPKLEEIQVFQRGRKRALKRLPPRDNNLSVVSGVSDGTLFVADEVLLGFKPGTTVDEFNALINQIGGMVVDSMPELGIYHVRLPSGTNVQALVDSLKDNPIIANAEPNYVAKSPTPITTGSAGDVVARSVTLPESGESVPLAILDSGLLPSSGLENLVVAQYDALNPDRPLDDKVGHGTQMAMIASGAVQPVGETAEETTEGVPLVAIRAFDDNGNASAYGIMKSIDFALKNGARVMNLSWGTEQDSEFLANAVAYAKSKGMTLVIAVGNTPNGKAMYPAAYPGMLGVGGLGPDGNIWENSNYGEPVDLSAPGIANFPVGHNGAPGTYAGTSIAAARVSRAITQYYNLYPNATEAEMLNALQSSLTDKGDDGRDDYYGYGALDAAALRRFLSGSGL